MDELIGRWLVCNVVIEKEFAVCRELTDLGVENWCPRYRRMTRPRNKNKPVWTECPMYPGYIFMRFDGEFELAALRKQARGFIGAVKFGQYVANLSDEFINTLAQDIESEQYIAGKIAAGDRVIIRSGPFCDYTGIVQYVANSHISVELCGIANPIKFPPFLIKSLAS